MVCVERCKEGRDSQDGIGEDSTREYGKRFNDNVLHREREITIE